MAHLDVDVAAFVDGQLSPEATDAATRHVQTCDRCREAVAQQRQLKRRMQASGDVRPPASLLASLSTVPAAPEPPPTSRWTWLVRSSALGAAGVLVGASLAVVLAAYLAGGSTRALGDEVVPPVAAYAADFHGTGPSSGADVMTAAVMADLTANGWPCHGRLGSDLERVEGRLQEEGSVSLTYTDGVRRLHLHEQNGALDTDGLSGFERHRLDGRPVWVRQTPDERIVTWDAAGVVYTVVTDLDDDDRLVRALRDLPAPEEQPGLRERLGEGLSRVSAWISA